MDYTDSDLVAMAAAVIAGISGNKAFPSPLVELPAFQAALADFTAAIIATAQGAITATADTNNKRAVLVEDLGEEAAYVRAHCDDNLNTLLSIRVSVCIEVSFDIALAETCHLECYQRSQHPADTEG